jgi:hypothetical protein
MQFFVGPMSKNIVDTFIDFSLQNPNESITFIPSRRQIDNTGGYVNHWTTNEFVHYVKSQNSKIRIERDHGGPGQGTQQDDGVDSILYDATCMDVIHIDPWKMYQNLDAGIDKTIHLLKLCDTINPELEYEIGTEEAIRKFNPEELEYMLQRMKLELPPALFYKIRYVVIQCGTALCEMKNIGDYDGERLKKMIHIAKSYNLIPKEHNGDWVSSKLLKKKSNLGLQHINIAPELAGIESKVILDAITGTEYYDKVFALCYESGKWKKWVSPRFDSEKNKDLLMLTCMHYIYSDNRFIEIKKNLENIDIHIKSKLYDFILSLYDIYKIRRSCIACGNNELTTVFSHDYTASLSLAFNEKPETPIFMPFNVLLCNKCYAAQTKYLGNLSIIYSKNHADNCGSLKVEMQDLFAEFVGKNKQIQGIVEFGACNNFLSSRVLAKNSTEYYIVEPDYTGDPTGLHIIKDYAENVDIQKLPVNTIVMSHLFEHLYEPMKVLETFSKCSNIEYIYLNHPDFEHNVRNDTYVVLNSEHTFYIEHSVMFAYFAKFGFKLQERTDYNNHSLFLCFRREPQAIQDESCFVNKQVPNDMKIFFGNMKKIVNSLHKTIEENPTKKYYMWPASAHSISLFACGFNTNLLTAMLDNSPNKIGKYLHSYNLYCESFQDVLQRADPNTCIIIGGAGQYIMDIMTTNSQINFIQITSLI